MIIVSVTMKKSDVEKRLEVMDREIHFMLAEVRTGKHVPLEKLKEKVSSSAKYSDTTEFIRKMRNPVVL